jgi:hypothetical protein
VHFAHLVETGTWFAVGGTVLALLIRLRGWSWTCGLPLLVAVPEASLLSWRDELCADAFAVTAVGMGAWPHLADLRAGGDLAQRARDRVGPTALIRRWYGWRKLRAGQWVTSQGVVIGFSRQGELVRIPIAGYRAVMSLLVGATGSGKTVVQVLLALAAIKRKFGVIYIDPKGDDFVREELRAAASRAGRQFREWDPQGKTIYNPYDRGSNTEIADKLLAAEVFTEPHYQRLAQRYIGHVIRALRLARRAGQPRDRGRAHAQRTPGVLDPQDDSERRPPATGVPRVVDAAAGAGPGRCPRPARDPCRVRRRSSAEPRHRRSTDRSPRIARPRRRRPLPARS